MQFPVSYLHENVHKFRSVWVRSYSALLKSNFGCKKQSFRWEKKYSTLQSAREEENQSFIDLSALVFMQMVAIQG